MCDVEYLLFFTLQSFIAQNTILCIVSDLMDVLHYSFSLSACPKCHLLVCQHTSLADLEFSSTQDDQQRNENESHCRTSTNHSIKRPHVRLSSHGMNFYLLPHTQFDDHYSWTTFGTDGVHSSDTMDNLSLDQQTISEQTPFANETIISASFTYKPKFNQIVRTQSERCQKTLMPRIHLTKSFSLSTIDTKPKSIASLRLSSNMEQKHQRTSRICCSNLSLITSILLLISYLLTNIFDLILLYTYYHIDRLCFITFIGTLFTCDLILWINNITDIQNLPTRLLLIPFVRRFYQFYELVELLIAALNDQTNTGENLLQSTSTSTSTTLETNGSRTIPSSFVSHDQHSVISFQTIKRRVFHSLTLFYLIHSSLLAFINIYFWSNNFQFTTKLSMNMDFFVPQWTNEQLSFESAKKPFLIDSMPAQFRPIPKAHMLSVGPSTMFYNLNVSWLNTVQRFPMHWTPSSIFIITSIFYYLIINYSILTTILMIRRKSWMIVLCSISRWCLIITRIYTLIFLIRLHAWWFTLTFLTVHSTFMITLLIDRPILIRDDKQLFFKFILSLLTHSAINDISVNALISLENISIFLHRLYLETFSSANELTLRFIVFISMLVSLQIIGFLFDILYKRKFVRQKVDKNLLTHL